MNFLHFNMYRFDSNCIFYCVIKALNTYFWIYRRFHNTPVCADKNVKLCRSMIFAWTAWCVVRLTILKNNLSFLIFKLLLMFFCVKYLCIVALLKPFFTPFLCIINRWNMPIILLLKIY